ncbi:hypothetical protein B0T11DRAFT_285651 [Plectosphaerella cucumerina]|uniref:Uncharacterized protein n=1 Tax=Plectosphaerella cucumerina TaxID=40658 RepID=A0A8K0TDQ3_9PEZI|nr:hypothetical protein B0T11DRAFT_285651 [Plectosphaerella cucumerina]
MLKTTTETGDIGIFSISYSPFPVPGHSRQVSRSRPSLDDSISTRLGLRERHETTHRDDRRRLPSYRDTASEIISLYGSNSRSHTSYGVRSPAFDDPERRSYSMVTTSPSRDRSLHQGGSDFLQRPRSPFPYPTRLRRPGVRPSSPALTENGSVDYSRMVGIDRVSYRTVHASYRAVYPQGHRQAPPVSMRPDARRPPYCLPSSSTTPALPRNQRRQGPRRQSGTSQSSGRLSDSNRTFSCDQSIRSSSLTSIVELYRRPASAQSTFRSLRPEGSFYYDYSEGFDDCPAPTNLSGTPSAPYAPIPRRASSLTKPLVLRDESEARLDAVIDVSVRDFSVSSTRTSSNQDTSDQTNGGSLDVRRTREAAVTRPGSCTSLQEYRCKDDADKPYAAFEGTRSDATKGSEIPSPDSLSSLADECPASPSEPASQASSPTDPCQEDANSSSPNKPDETRNDHLEMAVFEEEPQKIGEGGLDTEVIDRGAGGPQPFHRHKRNLAALRISTAKIQLSIHRDPEPPSTPKLCEPLDSAQDGRKIKLSPQQQPSVEPSPSSGSTASHEPFLHSFAPFYLPEIPTPRTATTLLSTPGGAPVERGPATRSPSSAVANAGSTPMSAPTYRGSIQLFEPSPAKENCPPAQRSSKGQLGRPLATKLFPRRSSTSDCEGGTVRRHAAPFKDTDFMCSDVPPPDLFDCDMPLEQVYKRRGRRFVLTREKTRDIPLAHPVTPRAHPSISTEGGRSRMYSLDSSFESHHPGLRKKISNLRLRIKQSRPHLRQRHVKETPHPPARMAKVADPRGPSHLPKALNGPVRSTCPRSTSAPAVPGRLRKWVTDARMAMKAYVRKTRNQEREA